MENKTRCAWCEKDDLYRNYHDQEWGQPVHDDHKMFEFLILETFQAGLSWYTILAKRENFRKAFDQFDFEKVSQYTEDKIQSLMLDAGIIRNQLKIRAAVSNAQAYLKVREEFGSFCNYMWGFIGGKPIDHHPKTLKDIPGATPLSDALSKDLKKRGFKFVGTTVVYAHMQATGMVNDHIANCWKRTS
ncbi:MAG: DNA-3-methyladenine glycosylase I [Bacteroidetes bacterium]|nr:DNA-3-methyladenine glycosylase I [Bacteroidota bacterium]